MAHLLRYFLDSEKVGKLSSKIFCKLTFSVHTRNCEDDRNVVMASNKTLTAKADSDGNCIFTILTWNDNVNCLTLFLKLQTDSYENVKLIVGTDQNYTYLEFK